EHERLGTIIGMDVSLKGLKRSADQLSAIRDFSFICMDSSSMGFRDETFDLVCISNSIHHLENRESTFEEMMRVLKPGGWFLASEMYSDGQTETQKTHVMLHHWWAAVDTLRGISHNRTTTREEIVSVLGALDLEAGEEMDSSCLDSDPLDKDLLNRLHKGIDKYMEVLDGIDGNEGLKEKGEKLRQRLNSIGFHSASSYSYLGRKPVSSLAEK
ncbi:MAG: methyltransferase domain-containing protein, partial [Candidatus Aegiribacteria sp.]|nr:methyltransferase domain-containing protein [Candidatus Aegiribacteria sp.]